MPEIIRLEIEKLFGAYDFLRRLPAGLRQKTGGTVAIAAIPTQATRYAAPAIKQINSEFPSVAVRLRILPSPAIIDDVACGKVDFRLVHSIKSVPERHVDDFGEQRIMCIASLAHRFAKERRLTCDDLLGET